MLKHAVVAVGIGKADIVEFNVPVQLLPVFTLRLKGVAVFRNDLRSVCNVGLCFKQLCHALYVDLSVDKRRNRVDDPDKRLHKPLSV